MATTNELVITMTYEDAKSFANFKKVADKVLSQASKVEDKKTEIATIGQAKREVDEQKHLDRIRRQNEIHQQRLEQKLEQSNAKILSNQNSWSKRMTDSLNNIGNSIKNMALLWVSSQVTSAFANAIKHADDIGDLAAAYELTTDAVQRLSFQFASAGTNINEMSGFIARLVTTQEEARGSGEEAVKAYDKLRKFGVGANDDVETAINKVIKAVKGSEAGVLALREVFGKLGLTALPILKDIQSFSELQSKYNIKIIGENDINALGDLQKQIDVFSESLKVAGATFILGFTGNSDMKDLINSLNSVNWKEIGDVSKYLTKALATAAYTKIPFQLITSLYEGSRVPIKQLSEMQSILRLIEGSLKTSTNYFSEFVEYSKIGATGLEARYRFLFTPLQGTGPISSTLTSSFEKVAEVLKNAKVSKEGLRSIQQVEDLIKTLSSALPKVETVLSKLFSWFSKIGSSIGRVLPGISSIFTGLSKISGPLAAIFFFIDIFKALANGANIFQAALYAVLAPFTQLIDLVFGTNWTDAIKWGWTGANNEAEKQLGLIEQIKKSLEGKDIVALDAIIAQYEQYNKHLENIISGYITMTTKQTFTPEQIAKAKEDKNYNEIKLIEARKARLELLKIQNEPENKPDVKPKEKPKTPFEQWVESLKKSVEDAKLIPEKIKYLREALANTDDPAVSKIYVKQLEDLGVTIKLNTYAIGNYNNMLIRSKEGLEQVKAKGIDAFPSPKILAVDSLEQYNNATAEFEKNVQAIISASKVEGAAMLQNTEYLDKMIEKYKDNISVYEALIKLKEDLSKKPEEENNKQGSGDFYNWGTSYEDIFGDTWEKQKNRIEQLVEKGRELTSAITELSMAGINAAIEEWTKKIELENSYWSLKSENMKNAGLEQTAYYRMMEKEHNKNLKNLQEAENKAKAEGWEKEQEYKKASMAADFAMGIFKIWAESGINVWFGAAMSALLTATYGVQLATLSNLKNPFRKYFGGWVGGQGASDNQAHLLAPGEFVVNSQAAKNNARALNDMNNGRNVSEPAINIHINGNVIGNRDYVRNHLAPEIKKAIKEGYSFA